MLAHEGHLEDFMIPCVNKSLFGVPCPGCGIQRSLAFIVKGEFLEAFYMYPAIYTLLLFVLFLVFKNRFRYPLRKKIILTLAIVNVGIIVVSYVIKMNNLYNLY